MVFVKSMGRRLKRVMQIGLGFLLGRSCPACGMRSILVQQRILWPELIAEWGLSPEWARHFDEREGRHCAFCRSALRDRQMAQGIVEVAQTATNIRVRSLKELCLSRSFQKLQVGEINSAGMLHQFLTGLPNVSYSQYGSTNPKVPSEDLMALSYSNATFDLVITSETLEHVPDVRRALEEIFRVIKPGGTHVFSVPVVWDRKETRRRAALEGGRVVHHMPPSYHGTPGASRDDLLVFFEFGADFVGTCEAAGFEVRLLTDSENPALVTFLARKPAMQY